jgi:hypothetical protein
MTSERPMTALHALVISAESYLRSPLSTAYMFVKRGVRQSADVLFTLDSALAVASKYWPRPDVGSLMRIGTRKADGV